MCSKIIEICSVLLHSKLLTSSNCYPWTLRNHQYPAVTCHDQFVYLRSYNFGLSQPCQQTFTQAAYTSSRPSASFVTDAGPQSFMVTNSIDQISEPDFQAYSICHDQRSSGNHRGTIDKSHVSAVQFPSPSSSAPISSHQTHFNQARSMSSNTVYFITGANRGLGLGLVKAYSSKQNTTVFATIRNPDAATELIDLAKRNPNVHILKLAVDSESDARAAAAEVERLSGGIDVVIANAGILNYTGSGLQTPIAAVEEHFRINTLGPLILFQSLYPLLKARSARKFVVVSTKAASIKDIVPLAITAYGSSKAALNFIARRLHSEHLEEGFVVIPLSPGWVATDMGNAGARSVGMEKAPLTVEESVRGMVKVIDGVGKEESGRFWSFDGGELDW